MAGEAERSAIASGVSEARSISEAGIEPQLDGHPIAEGLRPAERDKLTAISGRLLQAGAILQLRLRDNDGRVVFDASRPQDPPGSPLVDVEVQEAAAGRPVALLTRVGADEVDGARSDGARAVEVYLALDAPSAGVDSPSPALGVLELYVPFEPIAQAREAAQQRTRTMLLVGLAGLWLVLAAVMWSVTRRIHRQNEANRHLALHDPLTGLPNRALFADRAHRALATARRSGAPVTFAIVNLDRFKEVNDTLGHANGDLLLRTVADRIRDRLRPADTVARLDGDEFGLVLAGVGGATARQVLGRVQEAIGHEIGLDGIPVATEASIGWSEWPLHGDDPDELLRDADLALHAAKEGNNEVVAFDAAISPVDPTRVALVAELRRAINGDELELHYQPKIDLRTGEPVGFEALVRWRHPQRGLLPPNEFVPIAESTGLVGPLTKWVMERALRQLAEWGSPVATMSVAVNVSARNLRDAELTTWIIACLAEHRIAANRVVLEITETAFSGDQLRAATEVERLEAAGVCVSIDDFGQGYTSLSQLARLPVRELKIDGDFVRAMRHSPKDRAIVASVIGLGHQLGMNVVAEGVEDASTLEELRKLRCDVAQGFHLARPLAPGSVLAYLAVRAAPIIRLDLNPSTPEGPRNESRALVYAERGGVVATDA